MPVKNRFAELHADITEWRRDIHRHPELLFDTHRTAGLVAEKLAEFGCDEVVTGIGRTGVVGLIKGREDGGGRVVGLRADMDALPIEEETGVDYASEAPGKMHACGHDGHTAMLLGAARYLAETRNFAGTVAVIFQPAEEGGGGGRVMIEDGMMERFGIDEVYGMHNWPGMAVGQFAIRPGPFFAATDEFEILVKGKGGHAAKPHQVIDPIVTAAAIVTALQSIASRNVNPVSQAVMSVTAIESSSKAYNVIPQQVEMRGTIRTLDSDVRRQVPERMKAIAEATAAAFGATAEFIHKPNYPVMENAFDETEYAADAARAVSGGCSDAPLIMGGEDFAYMLNARPGAYILVGNGDSAPVHHPEYNFDDAVIPAGCSWFAEIAERRLSLG